MRRWSELGETCCSSKLQISFNPSSTGLHVAAAAAAMADRIDEESGEKIGIGEGRGDRERLGDSRGAGEGRRVSNGEEGIAAAAVVVV